MNAKPFAALRCQLVLGRLMSCVVKIVILLRESAVHVELDAPVVVLWFATLNTDPKSGINILETQLLPARNTDMHD